MKRITLDGKQYKVLAVHPDGGWLEVEKFFNDALRFNAPCAWIGSALLECVDKQKQTHVFKATIVILPKGNGRFDVGLFRDF